MIRIFFLIFLGLVSIIHAGEPAKLVVDVDRHEITIGQSVTLVIKLFLPSDAEFTHFNRDLNLGELELKDFIRYKVKPLDDGRSLYRYDYSVTSYQVGHYLAGPFVCQVTSLDGQTFELKKSALKLKVLSVIDPNDPVSDIRDQIEPLLPGKWSCWVIVLGGSVGVLLVVGLACLWIQKRRRDARNPLEPIIAADIAALESLEYLRGQHFDTQKQLYEALTAILRTYLERRFDFPVEESTSSELVLELKKYVSHDVLQGVRQLNAEADLVKFAKHHVEDEACEKFIEEIMWIIDQTKLSEGDEYADLS